MTCVWSLAGGATVYELPSDGSAVIGVDEHIKATYQDTLLDIAHRYSLGYEEIIRANPGVDMWLPGEGTDIVLPGRRILPPGPREGIVLNLPEHRLYYYPKPRKHQKPEVVTYPVSIGRMDWRSPLGQTHIMTRETHPNWYPPESIRKEHAANGDPLPKVVPPGPKNPLGISKCDWRLAMAPMRFTAPTTPWQSVWRLPMDAFECIRKMSPIYSAWYRWARRSGYSMNR